MAETTLANSGVDGASVVTKRRSPIARACPTTSSSGRSIMRSSRVPKAPMKLAPIANQISRSSEPALRLA